MREPAEVLPFDVCGPLPTGVTVLEASAGTGKTFTIAALAARYVAEGRPLEQLLVVTFTRMATSELRERVRERLVTAESGLSQLIAGAEPTPGDNVLTLLAEGSTAERQLRRARLARALADFDAATIATTHGFCQHALGGLGVAADLELGVTFVDDQSALVDDVVDDLYVRRFQRDGRPPPIGRREALRIGHLSVDNPTAFLEPRDAPQESTPAMRRRLAEAVRLEFERRKRQGSVLSHDDLLTRLERTLADPTTGEAACARLRSRYRVVLVDEFQDTDPVQWEIMRRAFGGGETTLVLIGDPKQAIYAFRGADVYAYLQAARVAGTKATLSVNWRSDQGLLDAYDALFGGARLGHQGIAYHPVRAADANQEPRLKGAPVGAALRLRILRRSEGLVRLTPQGYVGNAPGRQLIADDLAADLVALLCSGAEVQIGPGDGSGERERIRPGHIAVLVRTHRHAAGIREALERAGVPAVINGAGSVFGAPVAREWLRLLEALERPTSTPRARSVALTAFLGLTALQIAAPDEAMWEGIHAKLHDWAGVLRRRGVASLLEVVTLTEGLPGRLLARRDGERELTDLRHVGQLLHAQATSEQLGVTALAAWLRTRVAEAPGDTDDEERSRRLDSDAEAVQVLTIHRSKGLEFPVVYHPYLWEPGFRPEGAPVVFHDAAAGDARTLDVGLEGPAFLRHEHQALAESRGEDLRLAYVALTRAKHQAVVWWAGSYDSRDSPLGRLLFARDADGNVAVAGSSTPADEEVAARFQALAASAPGRISVEGVLPGRGASWLGQPFPPAKLTVSVFDRRLDTRWRRTSYSGITSAAHDPRVGSEPDEPVVLDEPGVRDEPGVLVPPMPDDLPDPLEARLRAVLSPLGELAAGAEIGTFVHRILETTDFATPDLVAALAATIGRERTSSAVDVDIGDGATLARALSAAIETPLGPLVDDLRLRDLGPADRLDEMGFELPLVGGDAPEAGRRHRQRGPGAVTLGAVAALLRRHLSPDDPLAGYASRLADPALGDDLRGYLSGSLDLVARIRDPRMRDNRAEPRFAVIDHKTNWLGGDGEALSAWHYRPAALAAAMQRAHYPLQALLYTVALHRYLRWRLPGYAPGRHLAGVLYLFLRGMSGEATPRVDGQPCGVFAWRPPAALVEALSDLFDRGEPDHQGGSPG